MDTHYFCILILAMTSTNFFFNILDALEFDSDDIREKMTELCNKRNLIILILAGIIGITYYATKKKNDSKPKDSISDADLPPYLNKDF